MKKKYYLELLIIVLGILSLLINNLFSYILLLPIWIILIKLYSKEKREFIFPLIFSLIFSFSQIIGYNCFKYDTAKLNTISTYCSILTLSPVIYIISRYLLKIKIPKYKNNKLIDKLFNKKYSFILITLIIFISWLPILIGLYPGNFSYDAGTQLRMLKFNVITKYHPVIHTMFLYLTIFLGNKNFHSYDIGLLIHSISQMLIMSGIFSYTLIYLYKKKIPNYLLIIFLLIYMFLPTHSVFSITTTKDIIFSGLFNLALIKLIELAIDNKKFLNSKKNIISTIIILVLLFAFRNNMLYAFIVFVPFIIIILRKHLKKVLLICLGSILIFKIYDITLTRVFKIENGPRVEMFSFVVQQLARVYNKENLHDEDKNKIEKLYINDSLKEYNSHISDPVKSNFNSDELLNNKSSYLKLYVKLFTKYPNSYIDSVLTNIYSFFYLNDKLPDPGVKTYIEINCLDSSNNTISRSDNCNKNVPFIYDLYFKLVHLATYQKIPILNIFMNMAFYFILLIFVSISLLLKKKYKLFIPLLLLLCYMLTNLLAPTAIIRYAYPLFTTFPLVIYLFIKKETVN